MEDIFRHRIVGKTTSPIYQVNFEAPCTKITSVIWCKRSERYLLVFIPQWVAAANAWHNPPIGRSKSWNSSRVHFMAFYTGDKASNARSKNNTWSSRSFIQIARNLRPKSERFLWKKIWWRFPAPLFCAVVWIFRTRGPDRRDKAKMLKYFTPYRPFEKNVRWRDTKEEKFLGCDFFTCMIQFCHGNGGCV